MGQGRFTKSGKYEIRHSVTNVEQVMRLSLSHYSCSRFTRHYTSRFLKINFLWSFNKNLNKGSIKMVQSGHNVNHQASQAMVVRPCMPKQYTTEKPYSRETGRRKTRRPWNKPLPIISNKSCRRLHFRRFERKLPTGNG